MLIGCFGVVLGVCGKLWSFWESNPLEPLENLKRKPKTAREHLAKHQLLPDPLLGEGVIWCGRHPPNAVV